MARGTRVTSYEPGADGGLKKREGASVSETHGDRAAEDDGGGEPLLGVEGEDGEADLAAADPRHPRETPHSLAEWAETVEAIELEKKAQAEKVKRAAASLKSARAKLRTLEQELSDAIAGRVQLKLFDAGGPRPDPDDLDAHERAPAPLAGPGRSSRTAGKRSKVYGHKGRKPLEG